MKVFIIIIILVIAVILISYLIGSLFVRYALEPHHGAEKRKVKTETQNEQEEKNQKAQHELIMSQAEDYLTELGQRDAVEAVTLKTRDNLTLHGTAYTQPVETRQWVILVHGYQTGQYETYPLIPEFYSRGFHVLTYSQRGMEESEGQYIGMGLLEKEDLIGWIQKIIEKDPDSNIILHGTSMGAATVLFASSTTLPSNVKGIISDAAYSSIWKILASEMQVRFHLPAFPVMGMADWVTSHKAGYRLSDGDVVEAVRHSHIPILYIHTKDDDFVPVEMTYELYEATPEPTYLQIFPSGGHANARYSYPHDYYRTIFSFIEDIENPT